MVDAVDVGRVAEAGLKPCGVFPQIVKQSCKPCDISKAKGGGKLGGEPGDVLKMFAKQLPLPRAFRELPARIVGLICGMGVVGGVTAWQQSMDLAAKFIKPAVQNQ